MTEHTEGDFAERLFALEMRLSDAAATNACLAKELAYHRKIITDLKRLTGETTVSGMVTTLQIWKAKA